MRFGQRDETDDAVLQAAFLVIRDWDNSRVIMGTSAETVQALRDAVAVIEHEDDPQPGTPEWDRAANAAYDSYAGMSGGYRG